MAANVEKEYAKALFELQSKDFKKSLDELLLVKEVLNENSELLKLMNHPHISNDEKKQVLTKSFKKFSILNFLYVLVDNNRFKDYQKIVDECQKLYYQKNNIVLFDVVTTTELTDTSKKTIEKALASLYAKTIIVNYHIEKEILGGIVIKCDGRILDNSYLQQLTTLKDFLTN